MQLRLCLSTRRNIQHPSFSERLRRIVSNAAAPRRGFPRTVCLLRGLWGTGPFRGRDRFWKMPVVGSELQVAGSEMQLGGGETQVAESEMQMVFR